MTPNRSKRENTVHDSLWARHKLATGVPLRWQRSLGDIVGRAHLEYKILPLSCSHPHQDDREKKGESEQTGELSLRQFSKWRKKKKMQSNHHEQAGAQPVPEQQLLWENLFPVYHWVWCFMVWDILLVTQDQLSQLCFFPDSWSHPVYSLRGQSRKQKKLMLCKQCSTTAKSSQY